MRAHQCHIRVGEYAWCQRSKVFIPKVLDEARKRGLSITCAQPNGAEAVAFVHMLQDLGVADATVAEGACEWDPANTELRELTKRRRATSPA